MVVISVLFLIGLGGVLSNVEAGEIPAGSCGRSIKSVGEAVGEIGSTLKRKLASFVSKEKTLTKLGSDDEIGWMSQPWLIQFKKGDQLTCTGVLLQIPSKEKGYAANDIIKGVQKVFKLNDQEDIRSGTVFFATSLTCLDAAMESDTVLVGARKKPNRVMDAKETKLYGGNGQIVVGLFRQWVLLDDYTQPICINEEYIDRPDPKKGVLANIVQQASGHNFLQLSKVKPSYAKSDCQRVNPQMRERTWSDSFCTTNVKAGKGSPFIYYQRESSFSTKYATLHGIVSGQYDQGQPGVMYNRIIHRLGINDAMEFLLMPFPQVISFGLPVQNGMPFEHLCFGLLIQDREGSWEPSTTALTTAQCALKLNGTIHYAKVYSYDEHPVGISRIAIHPNSNDSPLGSNIALVKLANKLRSKGYDFIIPDKNVNTSNTAGFLLHMDNGVRQMKAHSLALDECENGGKWVICIKTNGNANIEEGLPYFVMDDGHRVIYGIYTGTDGGQYYTNIANYAQWIDTKLKMWYPVMPKKKDSDKIYTYSPSYSRYDNAYESNRHQSSSSSNDDGFRQRQFQAAAAAAIMGG